MYLLGWIAQLHLLYGLISFSLPILFQWEIKERAITSYETLFVCLKVFGLHPKEYTECGFDIVTDQAGQVNKNKAFGREFIF